MSARSQPQVDEGDAIRMIEAHCRHARTMIPRGVVGVEAAIEYLHRLPHACGRMIPDLTGTAPKLARAATGFDLLATLPSEKVARALPRLIASVSPVVERRSDRVWTCWIARLLDPDMQATLRGRTPASQLRITSDPGDDPAVPRRALKRQLAVAEDGRKQAQADREELARSLRAERRRAAELQRRLDEQGNAQTCRVGDLEREVADLQGAVASLRRREAALLEDAKGLRSTAQYWQSLADLVRDTSTKSIDRMKLLQATAASVAEELAHYHGQMKQPPGPGLWWRPSKFQGLPAWSTNARGGTFWTLSLEDEPGIFGLLFVADNRTTHAYARGSLGALMLAARLMEAGVARPDACACAGVEAI